jgi:hypothetical protein
VDASGKVVLQPKYSLAGRCNVGLCPVAIGDNALNSKWGYIDQTGKLVIPAQFDRDARFWQGLAWVEQRSTLGYVNPKGTWVWKGTK